MGKKIALIPDPLDAPVTQREFRQVIGEVLYTFQMLEQRDRALARYLCARVGSEEREQIIRLFGLRDYSDED